MPNKVSNISLSQISVCQTDGHPETNYSYKIL